MWSGKLKSNAVVVNHKNLDAPSLLGCSKSHANHTMLPINNNHGKLDFHENTERQSFYSRPRAVQCYFLTK
ncbi:MAG: hypothetical protein B6242_06145 [Anaerolineaceae bacterium 4572_78]|nr:MAG: hypothetical protein B6242_06145 [Anaerolineaceae bacterium 4572_78]